MDSTKNLLKQLRDQYFEYDLEHSINFEKFSMISIIYNSTKIEGCELTEADTRHLIEKDITAKGKPLKDHLMIKDHYRAMLYIYEKAKERVKFSRSFIQQVTGLVMENTGSVHSTMAGEFDSSKGDLRKTSVYVDVKYFPDYKKIPAMLDDLCDEANKRIDKVSDIQTVDLAADVHYNLVNIHPFADGNGRVSRLMMNYVQLYHREPLIKIFTEDRDLYINKLNETEQKGDKEIFREFIRNQQIKYLQAELSKYENRGRNFKLLF